MCVVLLHRRSFSALRDLSLSVCLSVHLESMSRQKPDRSAHGAIHGPRQIIVIKIKTEKGKQSSIDSVEVPLVFTLSLFLSLFLYPSLSSPFPSWVIPITHLGILELGELRRW